MIATGFGSPAGTATAMSEPVCNATDAPTYSHTQNGKSSAGAELEEERLDNVQSAATACQIVLSVSEQQALTPSEWSHKWQQQGAYIASLEKRIAEHEGELIELRQSYERTKSQLADSQQRERQLVRRLAAKEQEMQDYVCQVTELKTAQAPTATSLRSTLLDPAVNSLLQLLRAELQNTKAKLEETQNDLSAWKFTPDSNTGKRLMAKCRLLYQENEELGKMTSCGRIAILEGDLALQKKFTEEVRQSQLELDSFLADLDEDVDGMQSTIMFLQQELRRSKDTLTQLQKENAALRQLTNGNNNDESMTAAASGDHHHDEDADAVAVIAGGSINNNNNNNGMCGAEAAPADPSGGLVLVSHSNCNANATNANVNATTNSTSTHRANGDSSGVCGEHDDADQRTTRVKRVRRSSVLSIDYNDEDMCNTNGDSTMISDVE